MRRRFLLQTRPSFGNSSSKWLKQSTTRNLADFAHRYHIIEGRAFFSSELTKRTTRVETVNGEKIYLSLKDKGLYVNNARVVKSDIITVSGVIHVLDRLASQIVAG